MGGWADTGMLAVATACGSSARATIRGAAERSGQGFAVGVGALAAADDLAVPSQSRGAGSWKASRISRASDMRTP